MAVMAKLPIPADTNEIGDRLQREYGSGNPNIHIQYFYIKLGREINQSTVCQQKITAILYETLGSKFFKTKPGWDGIVFFQSSVEATNEREQEKLLDENIGAYIKNSDLSVPIHAIISRACLYKETLTYDNKITTDEIGGIMDSMYGDGQDTDHENIFIEHFFLFVQACFSQSCFIDDQVHTKALEILKTLPGDWKSLEPQSIWQGTFFGLFPKETPAMTERDQEKLLNGEVRMPLIKSLKKELTKRNGEEPKVQVIITRACKYTPIKMDIP